MSSLSDDITHAIDPLQFHGDWQAAKTALISLIENLPRTKIVKDHHEYIHATFKSKVFGFVDDVEFVFDDTRKVIQVRSASRLGYYDFGVNRQRIEMLRARLTL